LSHKINQVILSTISVFFLFLTSTKKITNEIKLFKFHEKDDILISTQIEYIKYNKHYKNNEIKNIMKSNIKTYIIFNKLHIILAGTSRLIKQKYC